MKPIIVSFSSKGREDYSLAQTRLVKSIIDSGIDVDKMMYSFDGMNDQAYGIPIEQGFGVNYPQASGWTCGTNKDVPYQFKLAMIDRARQNGYKRIVWADSTIQVVKDFNPLLDASESGVVAFDNLGYPLQNWISDKACEKMGVNMSELPNIPQIMACCILFDFEKQMANEVFNEWLGCSLDGVCFQENGSIREGFKAHRHDQSILSFLLYKRGISFLPYGKMVYHPHDVTKEYGDDFYFINKGL